MTRLRGASFESPQKAQPVGGERSQYCRTKAPPNAPDVVLQNTIEVSDPSRVLPWYRDERRRRFNTLVRRYKNQLLYGCEDPGCRTPTCASRRRRVSEGPYRRYTELSARTLACYLASLDDAESGLCGNTPRCPPELTMNDYHRISQRRSRFFDTREQPSPPSSDLHQGSGNAFRDLAESTQQDPWKAVGTRKYSLSSEPNHTPDLDYAAAQRLKDPKSFTQNLFDTISLRMVEWLPLRRSTESFHPSSQQSTPQLEDGRPSHQDQEQKPTHESNRLRRSSGSNLMSQSQTTHPRTPSSRHPGTQHTAVELKFPNQHLNRRSLAEVESWRHSSRSSIEEKKRPENLSRKASMNSHLSADFTMPSPPALKHRPQKHRGRIGDLDSKEKKERTKGERRVSWHSEKILNQPVPTETTQSQHPLPPKSDINLDSPSERRTKRDGVSRASYYPPLGQTVTHLTPDIIDGLDKMMNQSPKDTENWREELDRIQAMGSFNNPDWMFATLEQREVFPFVAQSVFFVLSSTRHILQSFGTVGVENVEPDSAMMGNRLDVSNLHGSLQRLFTVCPWDIALHSLWGALDKLFIPPGELTSSARSSRRPSRSSTMVGGVPASPVVRRSSEAADDGHLSDADAAYIATVALFVLISSIPDLELGTWRGIIRMRATGAIASSAEMDKLPSKQAQQAVEVTDTFEHELGLRLANRLVRALAARIAYHEISKTRQVYNLDLPKQRGVSVLDRIVDHLSEHHNLRRSQSPGPASLLVEWLRTLFLREWDGNPEVACSSAAGGAVQIMALMYKERNRLGLAPEDFQTPLLAERLDPLDMSVAWVGGLSNNRKMHILSYPFLFPPSFLVIYFRSLNYSAMSKYFEESMTTTRHVTQTAFGNISITDDAALLARMKTSMSTYLVLVVRRDNVLTDALDQLWRREKRELMRPLKVQMGMNEGEEGLDHGGVQQEFFRVLMAEALDPSYGMFTMDQRHRLTWFRSCSCEPAYKFELLGLLVSIAIYNGLTLPVNFPIAFYRKLLGLKVKYLDHIRDGWPELTQGLESLLEWTDGDVGDIFMRTYEFSFESFGRVESVDMHKVGRDATWPVPAKIPSPSAVADSTAWSDIPHYYDPASPSPPSSMAAEAADFTPCQSISGDTTKSLPGSLHLQSPTPPSDEAALVTNQNRHEFVQDYIFWLTDKSIRPQFEAFLRGFHTCLDRSALSIFTPEALKTVVEGLQEIDVDELQNHARYEGGFGPKHRVIRDFWDIVRRFPAEKKAQLLEFVTASDRVPVNGISSIMFVIQKNGVGDLRLPTSLTCFGRLLLPEYSSKQALAEKLDKALENARGFGVA